MLIRLFAGGMILAGVSSIGFDYAAKLGQRKRWYEEFLEFLNLLQQEIHYGRYELKDCLLHASSGSNGFFKIFSEKLLEGLKEADGISLEELWSENILQLSDLFHTYGCQDEDQRLLKKLGHFFGTCSMGQQREQLQGLIEMASGKKAYLSEGLCSRQKAIRLLGICVGAFIVLALL
jgi:stage III sporulation protein AB